ncbi:hypothetical protein GW17_00052378, partial [Ensete ventricosum]
MGVEFPPRTENTAAIFTPPQTHPLAYQPATSASENMALESSVQSDVSAFSLQDIQNARGIADVLSEMLNALDPKNPEVTGTRTARYRVVPPKIDCRQSIKGEKGKKKKRKRRKKKRRTYFPRDVLARAPLPPSPVSTFSLVRGDVPWGERSRR